MPFPNVIAGILIGIVNESWLGRLIAPFAWGIVFCVYTSILKQDRQDAYIAHAETRELPTKWGMSYKQAFYFIEYMTATGTSLTFSIIFGFIKTLF